jgi:c(7)-type cytochrome triheme protein
MPKLKPWVRRPLIWVVGVLGIVVVVAALVGLVVTQAAPPQPFPYPHAPHIAAGIPCLFCHPGAIQGQSAGLPTRAKCLGCHSNINADTPALKDFADYASKNKTFEWVPVAIMPDFVYFSHRPHLAAGINCEECHGDVSKMTSAQPQNEMNMGWCLGCHKQRAPEKFVKLSDCATCHK